MDKSPCKKYKANKIVLGERIAVEKYIEELISRPENIGKDIAKRLKIYM
jgi:hypothetical protein